MRHLTASVVAAEAIDYCYLLQEKMGELVLLFGTECEQCLDKALCLF